jgi:hypothetical protein
MLIQFLPHREDTSFVLQSLSVSAFIRTINAYSETHECTVSQYVSQGVCVCVCVYIYIYTAWLYTVKAQLKLKEKAFTSSTRLKFEYDYLMNLLGYCPLKERV